MCISNTVKKKNPNEFNININPITKTSKKNPRKWKKTCGWYTSFESRNQSINNKQDVGSSCQYFDVCSVTMICNTLYTA